MLCQTHHRENDKPLNWELFCDTPKSDVYTMFMDWKTQYDEHGNSLQIDFLVSMHSNPQKSFYKSKPRKLAMQFWNACKKCKRQDSQNTLE